MKQGGAPPDDGAQARRFAALWDAYAARVQAYALRRVGPDAAEEVVAETFLIAWRRLAHVPGDPLPWLLVVARNTIANQRRSGYRRQALADELARVAHLTTVADAPEVAVDERETLLRALARLTSAEREALLLVGWDGLDATAAATVAGCTTTAFRMRLSRARRRLAEVADAPPASVPPIRSATTTPTLDDLLGGRL